MKSQAFFSALALIILSVVPTSIAHSTPTSTAYVESTTVNSLNSSQVSTDSTLQEPQQSDDGDAEPAYYETPEPNQHRSAYYYDEPDDMSQGSMFRNSTYLPEESDSKNPTADECPGPLDPNTGEAALDPNLGCSIVCYNNLVINDAGDACVCPPTFQFDPVEVKCVCRSPFVQRGSKCVLLPSQAARARHGSHKKRSLNQQVPLDLDLLHGKYLRTELDRKHCPDNEIACVMSSGGFECLDPEVTLDSCGGCASMGTGTNCRNITGANNVGCSAGACVVISCQPGFKLSNGSCVSKYHRRA